MSEELKDPSIEAEAQKFAAEQAGNQPTSVESDPRFRELKQKAALNYLKTKDADYFYKNYSGEVSPDGYLLDRQGKETNFLPSQNINDKDEIIAQAKAEYAKLYPEGNQTDQESEKTEDSQPEQPPVTDEVKIPEKWQNMSSEMVEEMWREKTYTNEDINRAETERRTKIIEAIKKQEQEKEKQKAEGIKEKYNDLPEDEKKDFAIHQEKIKSKLLRAIRGDKEVDKSLEKEELGLLDRLRTAYEKQPNRDPNEPLNLQMKQLDIDIFNNLTRRLTFENLKEQKQQVDKQQANEIRKDLGIPEQLTHTDESTHIKNEKMVTEKENYLDLANIKDGREKLLNRLETGNPNWETVRRDIYDAITTRSEYSELLKKYGNLPEVFKQFGDKSKEYYNYVALDNGLAKDVKNMGLKWESNPGWFGIDTRPEAGKREGLNYKKYYTLPLNQSGFERHIPELASLLRQIAEQKDDVIAVKIPLTFGGFLSKNDSIVIHFKKPEIADEIDNTVENWMSQNNIKEEKREMNRTKLATDSEDKSFSDLVADNIGNWLKENYGKYDNKLLTDMAMQYAIERSSVPPAIKK